MSEPTNPYSTRGPVSSEDLFFGRSRELLEIAQFLHGSQSVSLVGPPGIGKTSLLLQLMRPRIAAELNLGDGTLACYLDCATLDAESPGGLFRNIAAALTAGIKSRGLQEVPELRPAQASPSRLSFESALRALNRRGLQVVLFLDQFEHLSANPRLDVSFFNALRSIAGRYPLAYLTASAAALIDLTYSGRSQEILSSPLFNIFAPLRLGLLPEEDARGLIRKPAQQTGRPFSPDLCNFLYRLAGGHPMMLQTACHHAWERPNDRAGIEERTSREIQPYLEGIWRSLPELEKRTLVGIAGHPSPSTGAGSDDAVKRRLEQKSLLVEANGLYESPCKIWMDFLTSQIPPAGAGRTEYVPVR